MIQGLNRKLNRFNFIRSFSNRIRSIPFATLRPTFNEIKRVYDQLTKVEVYRKDN